MPGKPRRTVVGLFVVFTAGLAGAEEAPVALIGRVLDPQGRPAAGAAIHLLAVEELGPQDGTSAADGSFSFPVLPGIYRLSAEKDGFGAARRSAPLRVVHGTPPARIDLRLQRPATFSGRIVGLAPQELAAADVRLFGGHRGASGRLAVVGGGFRAYDLPPDQWTVQVRAGGRFVEISASLGEGEAAVRDVVFPRRFPVRGRVVGPDGAPIAGAGIQFRRAAPDQDPPIATTGRDGRFALLSPAGRYEAWAEASGAAPAAVTVDVVDRAVTGIEIRLPPGATLSGRLLGLRLDDCRQPFYLYAMGASPVGEAGHAAGGRYTISGLGPGDWKVVGHCDNQVAWGQLRVPAGEPHPILDLDFRPGRLTLSGKLRGEPGERYLVSLTYDFVPAGPGTVEVASGGSFRFTGLRSGGYRIAVFQPDLPGDDLYDGVPGRESRSASIAAVAQQDLTITADRELVLEVRP